MTTATELRDWTGVAASVASVVEEYRDQGERERRVMPPVVEAFRGAGLLNMLVPARFGGPEATPEQCLQAVEDVSSHDGAAGWCLMIWSGQGLFADYLPPAVAAELFAPGNLVCGAVNPTGRAVPVAGGFEVSGQWSFASGCQYATWLMAGCMVPPLDGAAPGDDGPPDIRLVILPASSCEIVDTWDAAGLRGSGSHDFRVRNATVASERTIPLFALIAGPDRSRGPVAYPTPFVGLAGPSIAAVGFGIARDAIESFKQLAASKRPAMGATALAGLATVQQAVGEAEALLRSARAYTYDTVREVTARHVAGCEVTDDDRAALRLASAHSVRSVVGAVDRVFDAAGGSSVYATSRLERCFRDIHMLPHHMAVAPSNVEMVGQYLLGGPLLMRR